jgi:hypothetical protein
MRAGLVLTLIFSIFAIAPLFYPGYFQTHSGLVPVWNVVDLRANWGNWSWLPQIAVTFDPLRSDGLLPYYLAALWPVQPVAAVKILLGLSWLLGSVGLFLWLRSWLGNYGAVAAALVYTYLPYQIATVYVRGAWGEALFWGLLPWAMLGTTFLVTSPRPIILPVAAFCWLALGLTQLGLTLWAAVFILLLLLVIHPRRSFLPILSAMLGTGAAIIINMFVSPGPITTPINFADHFLYPFQLFSAQWGYGSSQPGWADGFSLQLGLAAVGLTIISMALWQQHWTATPQTSRQDRRLIFFLGAAIILILLQLGMAAFIWQIPILPGGYLLASTLTYPWQLLGLTGLCLAILAGAAFWLDERLAQPPLFGAVVVLVLLSSYAYLSPQFIQVDEYIDGPEAQLGNAQLALVDHNLAVSINDNTAGLQLGETSIPLKVYGSPQANDLLLLTVTWQPLQPFYQDLKVFIHLVDVNSNVLAQYDGYPQTGASPTSRWTPGEMIEDTYPIPFPAEAPPGPYRVYLGLYDEATLTRLPVPTDPEGRVILNVE